METLGLVPKKLNSTNAKNKKRKTRQPKPKVEITKDAILIQKLSKLSWPGMESKKELQFHQQNYNYLRSLRARIKELKLQLESSAKKADKKLSKEIGEKRSSTKNWYLHDCVRNLYEVMTGPHDLAIWWATEVNKTAWKWDGWRGKLLDWTLTDRTERLRQLLCRIVVEFCEDNSVWPKIAHMLYGDNKERKEK